MILKSEPSIKHTFKAINCYTITVLSCGFPVLDWTITELKFIYQETRKMLQQYRVRHSQSDVTQLYLPKKNEKVVVEGLLASPTTTRMQ